MCITSAHRRVTYFKKNIMHHSYNEFSRSYAITDYTSLISLSLSVVRAHRREKYTSVNPGIKCKYTRGADRDEP